ncbi:hypothetical protein AVEN_32517-1 [Araneus ventricosus]|uniref:Uncharacterized protein n=1 Tax=Araneus ventricosus TaxID=182803 RepID=A0A4Y2G9V9_ARAVE|nr:hypothetical protein AVEN_32517-1 [Araneus ventricosus]
MYYQDATAGRGDVPCGLLSYLYQNSPSSILRLGEKSVEGLEASTFRFSNTNRQQITNNDSNSTFNSAQLTDFPIRTADEAPKSSFALRSRSSFHLSPFIYPSSTGRDFNGIIQYIVYISSPIEKIMAFSAIYDLSPKSQNLSPIVAKVRGLGLAAAGRSILIPAKVSSQQ